MTGPGGVPVKGDPMQNGSRGVKLAAKQAAQFARAALRANSAAQAADASPGADTGDASVAASSSGTRNLRAHFFGPMFAMTHALFPPFSPLFFIPVSGMSTPTPGVAMQSTSAARRSSVPLSALVRGDRVSNARADRSGRRSSAPVRVSAL